jgi:hypothetical protein
MSEVMSINSNVYLAFNSGNNPAKVGQALQGLLWHFHEELTIELGKSQLKVGWQESTQPGKDIIVIKTLQCLFGAACQLKEAEKKAHIPSSAFKDLHVQTFSKTQQRIQIELLNAHAAQQTALLQEAREGTAQLVPLFKQQQEGLAGLKKGVDVIREDSKTTKGNTNLLVQFALQPPPGLLIGEESFEVAESESSMAVKKGSAR